MTFSAKARGRYSRPPYSAGWSMRIASASRSSRTVSSVSRPSRSASAPWAKSSSACASMKVLTVSVLVAVVIPAFLPLWLGTGP